MLFDKEYDAYKKGLTELVVEYSNDIFESDPDNEIGLHVKAWWYRGRALENDAIFLKKHSQTRLTEMADVFEYEAAKLHLKEAIQLFKSANVCFNKVISLEPGNGKVELDPAVRTMYHNGLPGKVLVIQDTAIGLEARIRKGYALVSIGDLELDRKNEELAKKNHKDGAKALKVCLKLYKKFGYDDNAGVVKMRELIIRTEKMYDEYDAHNSF